MKLLFVKIFLYVTLIFICLEVIVRVFHLYDEYPQFIINDKNVKTYVPNQKGYTVTGNRRMNFSQYNINKSGFNSYREFKPSKYKVEIAIIGDSFIEGLHQNYNNSIGKKIENKLKNGIDVFEYGHSGYDFADQLHLIDANSEIFDLIDEIIIYLKFENDLQRNVYEPDQYWIETQYFTSSKIKKNIKLFAYIDNIGLMDHLRAFKTKIISLGKSNNNKKEIAISNKNYEADLKNSKYLENFKKLIKTYGFNKNKIALLLDIRKTNKSFLNYCDSMNYKYIDFGKAFENSKTPTTLIYDMHWNNHGRDIIATVIENYYIKEKEN